MSERKVGRRPLHGRGRDDGSLAAGGVSDVMETTVKI